jgi:hypothetical protein
VEANPQMIYLFELFIGMFFGFLIAKHYIKILAAILLALTILIFILIAVEPPNLANLSFDWLSSTFQWIGIALGYITTKFVEWVKK